MSDAGRRKISPEQLLKQVEAEEKCQKRGKLKVFLGYASGVGKSFRMLDEGRRRKQRGQDVVVAGVQPEAPPEVEELMKSLEVIPPRLDFSYPCIDVAAVLRRRPAVCLIDGLAYRNPVGSKNQERWQDVEEILEHGIAVITTVNLQYIREKQAQVEAIRGRKVNDSVPESFLRRADDIEVVDAPAEHSLDQLREIALVLAAEVVDAQLDEYLKRQGIGQSYGTQERILICVTPRSNAELMIARGKRQADRFHGELFVAYVEQDGLSPEDSRMLAHNLDVAREVQAHVEILHGEDPVNAILAFAEKQGITQIFVGHSQRRGWLQNLRPNPVERLILESTGIDIRIFPNRGQATVS